MDIKRMVKAYCEPLYAHKFNHLNQLSQFLERHNLPKCVQEEIDNLMRTISIKKVKSVISNPPNQKAAPPDGFTDEFPIAIRKIYCPVLYTLFQKIEAEKHILTHSVRTLS